MKYTSLYICGIVIEGLGYNLLLFTDQFDQEFRQAVQRLPRTLTSLLSPDDYPPSLRAQHCRTDFGPLQVT